MELVKISDCEFEMKKEGKMLSSAKIFADEKILEAIKKDKTLEQLKNMACLPGLEGNALALPDAHQGYGFCIGGVAALRVKD